MTEAEKAEFEQFQRTEQKLIRIFAENNHPRAAELGFFVAQAMRDVPPLLQLLEDVENHSNDEILDAIHLFVTNHSALSEANRLLTTKTGWASDS